MVSKSDLKMLEKNKNSLVSLFSCSITWPQYSFPSPQNHYPLLLLSYSPHPLILLCWTILWKRSKQDNIVPINFMTYNITYKCMYRDKYIDDITLYFMKDRKYIVLYITVSWNKFVPIRSSNLMKIFKEHHPLKIITKSLEKNNIVFHQLWLDIMPPDAHSISWYFEAINSLAL